MDSLVFAQINTHHCKAAMAHLSPYTHNNKVDVLIIQEPYCYNEGPCYIPQEYLAFFAPSNKNPRASLLIKRDIAHKFMFLHQFSNPDNAIVVTATNPPIHLPTYNTLKQDLTPIETFLTTVNPKNFIWGLDTNSKHSLWHSPTTDSRGRMLANFLSSHGLLSINEKDGPTYSGPTGDSWIDITVSTNELARKIQHWRVSEENKLPDHSPILFSLRTQNHASNLNRTTSNPTRRFATQAGNWKLFQLKVLQHRQQWVNLINNSTTKENLNTAITIIWDNLGKINKTCFAPFLPKTKYVPWWSPKLNALRKQVNALKRRVKNAKTRS